MPSPRWSDAKEAPLFQALAAAQHVAWHAPEHRRNAAFAEHVRRLLGADRSERVLSAALGLFQEQAIAPAGFEAPPDSAYFTICPRCQELKGTKFTIPISGRLKLAVLRDREWLQQQFERGRSAPTIAKQLGCTQTMVTYFAERHGLLTPRQQHTEEWNTEVARLHRAGKCPGEISREMEIKVQEVRKILTRLGLATSKQGHHYFVREWWVERIERQGWTTTQCARVAGIVPHNCAYFLKKFGLQEITKARSTKKGERRWTLKYPALGNPVQLKALLDEHGSYEAVARHLGCYPTLVSSWARKLLGAEKRHNNHVPHSARAWWTERLKRGLTMLQLAEEAGITEHSARERLRLLGAELLAQGYRNNLAAEKAKRAPKPKPWWVKPDVELQEAVNA